MTDQRLEIWNGPYAGVYHRLYELWPMRQMLDHVIAAGDITDSSRVLDVGCGSGFLLQRLRELGLAPSVVGVDFSPGMLKQAKAQPYAGSATFVQADFDAPADAWGLAGLFDVIVLVNTLYIAQRPEALIRKLTRFATEGGRLIIATPGPEANPQAILEAHLEWTKAQGRDVEAEATWILGDPDFQSIMATNRAQVLGQSTYHYMTLEQLRKLFHGSPWRLDPVRTTYADQNWLVRAERGQYDHTYRPESLAI